MKLEQKLIEYFNDHDLNGIVITRKLKDDGVISTSFSEVRRNESGAMEFTIVSSEKNSGNVSAKSIKATNVVLNMRRMISVIPELIGLKCFLEGTNGYKVLFVLINALLSVIDLFTIELTDMDAICLYAIWKSAHLKRKISEEDAFIIINTYMSSFEKKLSKMDYNRSINNLNKYGIIKIEEECIVLIENVYLMGE